MKMEQRRTLIRSGRRILCLSILAIVLLMSMDPPGGLIKVKVQGQMIRTSGSLPRQPVECGSPSTGNCQPFDPDPWPENIKEVPKPQQTKFWSQFLVSKEMDIPEDKKLKFQVQSPKLYRYVEKVDIGATKDIYEGTTFQLLEWPGLITTEYSKNERLDIDIKTHDKFIKDKLESNKVNEVPSDKYIPYDFYGKKTKFISYQCNRLLGTHIRAVGFRLQTDTQLARYKDGRKYTPFYLSREEVDFNKQFVQPHLAPAGILNKMVKDHLDPQCRPVFDGAIPKNNLINRLYDFSFTDDRVLLAMHCGILYLDRIVTKSSPTKVAIRNPPPEEFSSPQFIKPTYVKFVNSPIFRTADFKPVHLIASSVCCSDQPCQNRKPLAAAYSYKRDIEPLDVQFVYVSYDRGETWDQKLVSRPHTSLRLIRRLYQVFGAEDEDGNLMEHPDPEPIWVTEEIANAKKLGTYKEGYDNDPVIEILLGNNATTASVPEMPEDEKKQYCARISSIEVAGEEGTLTLLCRIDQNVTITPPPDNACFPLGKNYNVDNTANSSANGTAADDTMDCVYAMFSVPVPQSSPVIFPKRITKRLLPCKLSPQPRTNTSMADDPTAQENREYIEYFEPEIIRVPPSDTIYIAGCYSVIYHTTNGGKTFNNVVFYKKDASGEFRRFTQDENVVFPLFAWDFTGNFITFTEDDWYGMTTNNYARESRFIMGKLADTTGRIRNPNRCADPTETPGVDKACTLCLNLALKTRECQLINQEVCKENAVKPKSPLREDCNYYEESIVQFSTYSKFLPYFTNSGSLEFALCYMHMIRANNPNFYNKMYEGREGIRFVNYPVRVTDPLQPFFDENTKITRDKKWMTYKKCSEYGFQISKGSLELDIGEKDIVEVHVEDRDGFQILIPLTVITSQPHALTFTITRANNRSAGKPKEQLNRDWDVEFEALPEEKDRVTQMTDAFFGAEYTKYVKKSSFTVMTILNSIRCPTQPSGFVYMELACPNKILVAHEDYYRPQCSKFIHDYNYTYEWGEYDPEMMQYMIDTFPDNYKMNRTTKKVTAHYNYEKFGCPMLPYRLEPYEPDLRILDKRTNTNLSDTVHGELFNRSYILIELHGAKGFTFNKTNRDADCKSPPQTFETMLGEWKGRRRIIRNAFRKFRLYDRDAVQDPRNIWNRVNYEPCQENYPFAGEMTEELKDKPYEVLKRGSSNFIQFDPTVTRELFIFLAVEVDADGSFCEFSTIFGVYLKIVQETDDWISFLRFTCFLIFLICFVILTFYTYRYYVRRGFREKALLMRLERGAWQILSRYDRILKSGTAQDLKDYEKAQRIRTAMKAKKIYSKELNRERSLMKEKDPDGASVTSILTPSASVHSITSNKSKK